MRIIITGATGFVGAAAVRHFSKLGYKIIAIGRTENPPTPLTNLATYVRADISKFVPKIKGDICIHAAALTTDQADYQSFYETNYLGTKRVFEAIECKSFIQISSSSVYPFENKTHREDETIPLEKLSSYGKTKRLAEVFLEKQKSIEKSIFILRPRAIYGKNDKVLLPRILNLVKKGKIKVPGDLKVDCSLTHIDNLILAIEKCILSDFDFRIYNVADDATYQLRGIVNSLASPIFEKEIPIQTLNIRLIKSIAKVLGFLKIPTRLTMMSINSITQPFILDIEKIKTELDYQPKRNFSNASLEIIDWVKEVGKERVLTGDKELAWNANSVNQPNLH